MFTKLKFRIALRILRFVAIFCPHAFKHLDFDCLRDEETNLRIKFNKHKRDEFSTIFTFETTINGRRLTSSISVDDMEMRYYRDHAQIMEYMISDRLYDMFHEHLIRPMVEKDIKKVLK